MTAGPEALLAVAMAPFLDRLMAERLAKLRPGAADWELLNLLALDLDNLPRVVVRLGYPIHVRTFPRGAARWWPDSIGPLLCIAEEAERPGTVIDLGTGTWRGLPDDHDHPRGRNLIELACWRLNLPFGKAAMALARMSALDAIPQVPMR